MAMQWCTNYQFHAPPDAAAVAVTPNGSAWVDSSWVDVFVADADCVITGVNLYNPGSASRFRIDVGVSNGGTTLIGSLGGVVSGDVSKGWGHLPFRYPVDAVPSGQTVRVRLAKSGTSTTNWFIAVQYFKQPIVGTIELTTGVQTVSEMNPMVELPEGATAWTNGNWANLHTAGSDLLITGIIQNLAFNGANYILDLGISDSPIWTLKQLQGFVDYPCHLVLPNPLFVASGSVIQGRWRKSVGLQSLQLPIALSYIGLPL